jgi:hypothetical protein
MKSGADSGTAIDSSVQDSGPVDIVDSAYGCPGLCDTSPPDEDSGPVEIFDAAYGGPVLDTGAAETGITDSGVRPDTMGGAAYGGPGIEDTSTGDSMGAAPVYGGSPVDF